MYDLLDHPRLPPMVVMAVSIGALMAAFAAELAGGLEPCVLCIYQRYAYGVAFAIGLTGAIMAGSPRLVPLIMVLAGLTFLGGAGIALFHVGVEQHWWRGTDGCHAPALDFSQDLDDLRQDMLGKKFVACDQVSWSFLGLSIAAYNAILSLILAALCFVTAARVLKLEREAEEAQA